MLLSVLFCIGLISLPVAARRGPHWSMLDGYTFEQYVNDFRKKYGKTEFENRRSLFNRALEEIQQHNVNSNFAWKQGVNRFTDWSESELHEKTFGNIIGSLSKLPPPEKMYEPKGGPLPADVDWRLAYPPVVSAVKDQGHCGSCYAFASAETIESLHAIATSGKELFVLSPEQLASCTPNPEECGGAGGCTGGTYELSINYAAQIGLAQEWVWSYTSYFGTSGICNMSRPWEPQVAVSGFTKVKENDQNAVLDALANVGPLAISVDATWWHRYEEGIFHNCTYNISMNHAVQLVGYGTDPVFGLDYFLVRNSWSSDWGEAGYIRLQRTNPAQCGWNVNPQNGIGCSGETAPQWTCGECAVNFDAVFSNPKSNSVNWTGYSPIAAPSPSMLKQKPPNEGSRSLGGYFGGGVAVGAALSSILAMIVMKLFFKRNDGGTYHQVKSDSGLLAEKRGSTATDYLEGVTTT